MKWHASKKYLVSHHEIIIRQLLIVCVQRAVVVVVYSGASCCSVDDPFAPNLIKALMPRSLLVAACEQREMLNRSRDSPVWRDLIAKRNA